MKASLTNDSELKSEPMREVRRTRAIDYLNADPRNAIVINWRKPVYVIRGAGEGLDNFYYGEWPAQDPNDANGGDLTATEAIEKAMNLSSNWKGGSK